MSWDFVATLLLLTVVIQLILLVVSLVYNRKIIEPNKDKLFWRIRRPKYFIFYIVITLLNDSIRCFSSLLLHINIINTYWYSLISVPLAYFGGITWGSIRLWLLYYDIKIAKKNQLFLLSKHLTTTSVLPFGETTINMIPHKLKRYQSITIKVVATVIICCIITLFVDIVLDLTVISKLLVFAFIVFLLTFYTYFIFKLYCKCSRCDNNENRTLSTSAFRDDWLLLLELTIIWIMWIIGIVCALLLLPLRGKPIHAVFIAFLTMITRVIITLTMMIVPYKLSLRLHKNKTKSITLLTLKNILSTKSYFFSFVEHLVQELAIENLTFLLEIWQFKYEEKYGLKPSKLSKEIKDIDCSIQKTNASASSINCDWLREVTPTIEYDSFVSLPLSNITINQSVVTCADIDKLITFLDRLPWCSLPLAQSISCNLSQKWKQCHQIYSKYLDDNSYDAVNVSFATRSTINAIYYDLLQYEQFKNSDKSLKDNELPPSIQNDDEFHKKIINVFDIALNDIVQNLKDSLSRFVMSEQFRLAN